MEIIKISEYFSAGFEKRLGKFIPTCMLEIYCHCDGNLISFVLSSIFIIRVDEVGPSAAAASTRGRGRSRSKAQSPAIHAETVIVQRVSDLAAAVSAQSNQMRATNENVNRLTELMAQLTENVRISAQREQFIQEDREFSDTDSDSDISVGQPRPDPFEGLFDEHPELPHEAPEEKVWDNLLASTECATEYGPELPVDLAVSLDRVAAAEPIAERLKTWKQAYVVPANAKKLAPPVCLLCFLVHRSC